MKRVPHVVLLLMLAFVFGCDGGYDKETSKSDEMSSDEMSMDEMSMDKMSMDAKSEALLASAGVGGAEANNEGVSHYQQGHWDVAQEHFQKAVSANADLAEAHYNLALTLDKMGNHGDATKHFQMAMDHGSDNPGIKDSGILKAHLGM